MADATTPTSAAELALAALFVNQTVDVDLQIVDVNELPINMSAFIDDCTFASDYIPSEAETRFWMTAVFGTFLSSLGVLGNVMLAFSIFRQRQYRCSHFMYYGHLALCDAFVSLSYVLIHGNHEIIAYMHHHNINYGLSLVMLRFWWWSFRLVFTSSHVCSVVASYLILAATFERYVLTAKKSYLPLLQRNRIAITLVALGIGLIMKASNYLEFDLVRRGNCTGLSEFVPQANPMLAAVVCMVFQSKAYNCRYAYFKFYGRTIVCTLVPFTLLLLLNVLILQHMHEHKRGDATASRDPSHKARIKSATQLLIILVSLYLLGNSLNVFITVWEFVAYDSLENEYRYLYIYVVDLISLLVVVSSVVRVPIYLIFNADMRSAFGSALHWCCCGMYFSAQLERKKTLLIERTRSMLRGDQSTATVRRQQQQQLELATTNAAAAAGAGPTPALKAGGKRKSVLDMPLPSPCTPAPQPTDNHTTNSLPSLSNSKLSPPDLSTHVYTAPVSEEVQLINGCHNLNNGEIMHESQHPGAYQPAGYFMAF